MSYTKVSSVNVIESCKNYRKYIERKHKEEKDKAVAEVLALKRTWYRWFVPKTEQKAIKYIQDCTMGLTPWFFYYVPSSIEQLEKLAKNSEDGYVLISSEDIYVMKHLKDENE